MQQFPNFKPGEMPNAPLPNDMAWNPNMRPQFFKFDDQFAPNMKDDDKNDDYQDALNFSKYENFMLDVEKSPRLNGKIFGTQKVDH